MKKDRSSRRKFRNSDQEKPGLEERIMARQVRTTEEPSGRQYTIDTFAVIPEGRGTWGAGEATVSSIK
jgi:ribosomal protein S5